MKCLEVKRHVSGTVQEKMCRERDQKKKRNNSQQIKRQTRRELENRVKGVWEFFVPFL